MSFRRRSRRCTAIALAALGLAAPVAQARLIDPPLGHHARTHAVATKPVVTVKTADSGLDWGSIGLGAGGFFAIVAGFAGANAVIVRRRRIQAVR